MSQSSNDVIPTALHVSAYLALRENLPPALRHLAENLERKSQANQALRELLEPGRLIQGGLSDSGG